MATHLNTKNLGLNIDTLEMFSVAPDIVRVLVFIPGLVSSSFVVCLEFRAIFGQILEIENELNRDWFRGVLRPYGALCS